MYKTNKKIQDLNDKLDRFMEIYEMNMIDKQKMIIEMTEDITKKYLPKTLEEHFVKKKIEEEKKRNMFYNRV